MTEALRHHLEKYNTLKQRIPKERLENTDCLLRDFIELKPGEKVLFITDKSSFNTDKKLIEALKESLKKMGNEFQEIVADEKLSKEKLFQLVEEHQLIWNSWGMEETKIDFDELTELIEEKNGRMVFCPGLKAKALDKDGSLTENKDELENRLGQMENRLRNVVGFHITSVYGTNLSVELKTGERRWFKETGVLRQGGWSNLPGGEIFTTPDEEKINGVLVLPILTDEVSKNQGVDEFVHLTIRNGKIAKIDGGKSAEKLRKYLEKNSREEKNPSNVLQCSEIAFGANSKAKAAVSNPEKPFTARVNSTVEAEKRLGTMHFAFGDSKHGEEGAEGFTESDIHLDFILPRNGLTVKAFKNSEDFKKQKNGERLIDEGRWNFI